MAKKVKSIINNNAADLNKLVSMNYLWARRHYKDAVANSWLPEEIAMQHDIEQWQSTTALTQAERRLILCNIAFFSAAKSLTINNLILAIYPHLTNSECRHYLVRQAFEETVHSDAFIYCSDSLELDPDELYNMHTSVASIKAKNDFVVSLIKSVLDPNFTTQSVDNIQKFLRALVGLYLIEGGIFLHNGFAMILALKRNDKMVGVGQLFELMMRDERLHLAFGCDLINSIKAENPACWSQNFQDELVDMIKQAVELEKLYLPDACPQGILGIDLQQCCDYVEHVANCRLERIDLPKVYSINNPFPWISLSADKNKEKSIVETRMTEYQTVDSLQLE